MLARKKHFARRGLDASFRRYLVRCSVWPLFDLFASLLRYEIPVCLSPASCGSQASWPRVLLAIDSTSSRCTFSLKPFPLLEDESLLILEGLIPGGAGRRTLLPGRDRSAAGEGVRIESGS